MKVVNQTAEFHLFSIVYVDLDQQQIILSTVQLQSYKRIQLRITHTMILPLPHITAKYARGFRVCEARGRNSALWVDPTAGRGPPSVLACPTHSWSLHRICGSR
jgi:hypothetical protein